MGGWDWNDCKDCTNCNDWMGWDGMGWIGRGVCVCGCVFVPERPTPSLTVFAAATPYRPTWNLNLSFAQEAPF